MAVLWDKSLVPWHDASNAPYTGAKAYFFDVGTTTPQITYTDAALSIPHDHPVVALANGWFPPVFLPDQSSHRLRILDGDDNTLWDVDNISVPTTTPPEIPDSETPTEQLFQTGDLKWAIRSSAPTGWVRANGRTIGSAASGASERANADCEDLYLLLWNNTTLSVAGGRGGTANGDWAADKAINLPDLRGRVVIGPDSFGNSAAGRVTDANLGADSDTLLSAGGAETHTLIVAELPEHTHDAAVTDPGHTHALTNATGVWRGTGTGNNLSAGSQSAQYTLTAESNTTGITVANSDVGEDTPHNNLQPSVVIPAFIKL
ncbi:MAG: hypothetical protein KF810_16820 [Rhizobiaceae bacterium]|nr:hypothetical protein [Rhizobiaceae bacterium]